MNLVATLKRIFKKNWVQHFVFWIALVILFALFRTIRNDNIVLAWRTLLFELIPFSGVASAVYINLNILLPRFLSTKRYYIYGFGLFSIALLNAIVVYIIFTVFGPFMGDLGHGPHPNRWMFFPAYMMMQFIFVSISSFFHFIRENNRLTEIALSVTEIESNRLRAELNSLKAQINPHFLFNTLNNIYSYSLFKSEKTPEMILKLSGLMNYIIYECQADQVGLSKEIDFIRNYVELEKMRVEDTLEIKLDIQENPYDFQIAPLLFVPFLENAFKHGVNIQDQQPYIRLQLEVSASGLLHFECENLQDDTELDDPQEKSGGIGLENVRKRLELLYPGACELKIDRGLNKFQVNLKIQLKDS
ncbi:MAG: histidine kinase [Candidatus Marinimicrobia bacterium]|nr:histidine kinase [Candidatus Neomarinimicrobiota bacterium]